ncbi:lactonase family protein [Vibrio mexicanus]|uniref:lactonase family protein n=1 Tax=Vibrio mexicanus TaxID=1004326 RepID=UPI00063C0991|nr:lactonase family protein [Vibrio mexicanus]
MTSVRLYIGAYTEAPSLNPGLQSVILDPTTGQMTLDEVVVRATNPSYVITGTNGVYTASEVEQECPPEATFISNERTASSLNISGSYPCHLAINKDETLLATAQYGSGCIDVFSLNTDGHLNEHVQHIQQTGSGPNQDRQTQAHAHQVQFLKTTNQLVCVDLGSDSVHFYNFEEGQYSKEATEVAMPAGSGPRHLVFNQDDTIAYVLCELSETIVIIAKQGNEWKMIKELPALAGEENKEAAAAIRLSADGKFVYASLRAQSLIACYRVSNDGLDLNLVSSTATHGDFPRDFAITSDGTWLVAANQHSNSLTSFKRDTETGELTFSGQVLSIDAPVCITY